MSNIVKNGATALVYLLSVVCFLMLLTSWGQVLASSFGPRDVCEKADCIGDFIESGEQIWHIVRGVADANSMELDVKTAHVKLLMDQNAFLHRRAVYNKWKEVSLEWAESYHRLYNGQSPK